MKNRRQGKLCLLATMTSLCLFCGTTEPPTTQPVAVKPGPPSQVYYVGAYSLYTRGLFYLDTVDTPGSVAITTAKTFPYFFKRDSLVPTGDSFFFAESTLVVVGETLAYAGLRTGSMDSCTELKSSHLTFYPYLPGFFKEGITDSVHITGIDSLAQTMSLSYRGASFLLGLRDSMLLTDSIFDTTLYPRDSAQRIEEIDKVVARKTIRFIGKKFTRYRN